MFLKKINSVCVCNVNNTCRLVCVDKSKEIEFSVHTHRPILQFNDVPTAKRLPLIGTKFDILLSGLGRRFVRWNLHTISMEREEKHSGRVK